MRRVRKKKNIKVDRISELPECIVHDILSYLPIEDVVQTTILSKRWYSMNKNYPVLCFDFDYFIKNLKEKFAEGGSDFRKALKTHRKHVYKSLHRFSRKKDADCPLLENLTLDSCEGFNRVYIHNLLRLHSVDFYETCYTPVVKVKIGSQSIQNVSITASSLARDWVKINIDACDHLKFLLLRCEGLEQKKFHSLIAKLPLLEELYIFNCQQLRAIKISSPRIKTLVVWPDSNDTCLNTIEIAAPRLENFIFISERERENPCVIKVADCCVGLKTLMLRCEVITDKMFHKLISKWHLLESLWIFGCNKLRRIKILSPQLKRLHIVRCPKLQAVEVGSRNLLKLFCGGPKEPEFSVADHLYKTGGLRFVHEVDLDFDFLSYGLAKMLRYFIRDEDLVEIITTACSRIF
ncbi:hypothetical protein SLEP1_g6193 [Rubroshorea leprosula]|uniref:F-box domain-containing protein n=1 Tax=Rubroshorea leprosula TaxID=152421 RepID=A0AAV5I3A0_9ROSI|nr:hypothetical protein SLEP1_g6193 [Rubroshorea leprosula]